MILLPHGEYRYKVTGKVYKRRRRKSRTSNKSSIYRTRRILSGLILSNFYGEKNELLITLTYKASNKLSCEDKGDTEHSSRDIQNYFLSLRRFLEKVGVNLNNFKYLWVREPNEDGSFHFHALVKLVSAKTISSKIQEAFKFKWKWGMVDIRPLEEANLHVERYFMPTVTDLKTSSKNPKAEMEENVSGQTKAYIEGERLKRYPHNSKIYGRSKNLNRPTIKRGKMEDFEFSDQAEVIKSETKIVLAGDVSFPITYVRFEDRDIRKTLGEIRE